MPPLVSAPAIRYGGANPEAPVIVLLFFSCADPAPVTVEPSGPPAAAAVAPTPAASVPSAPAAPDPAAAPPADPAREAADEAFNTAMRAFEGNSPSADGPIRAALAAYQALPQLDSDGQFHEALLQHALGDEKAARATADTILAAHPKHVLALDVAARASESLGDKAAARKYYQAIAEGLDQPMEPLPEFDDHARLVPKYQEEAVRWLTADGG